MVCNKPSVVCIECLWTLRESVVFSGERERATMVISERAQ